MRQSIFALIGIGLIGGCASSRPATHETTRTARMETCAVAAEPPAAVSTAVRFVPVEIDLRGRLKELGLTPRAQGHRGTCSIFTTCEAIEFAMAMRDGHVVRQSPEFLNWAGAQIICRPTDGNFFHNALAGYDRFGICAETSMPYTRDYDAANGPTEDALKRARGERAEARGQIAIHWIVPWAAGKTGVNEAEFAEIKRVLKSGYPVAAGSGHSRLLVGYVDDARLPGGGKFYTEDSALARFDEVTYEFVVKQVNDVFWVEAESTRAAGAP